MICRFTYLLCITLLLTACVTTKPKVIQFARVCIEPTDGIIIEDVNSPLLSEKNNLEIRNLIINTIKDEGFSRVYNKHELEYDLLTHNIKGISSEDDRYEIHRKLDIKYILVPTVLNMRESESSDVVYKDQVMHPTPRYPLINRSLIEFDIIETASNVVVYKVKFENTDTEFSKEKEDSEVFYNHGSAYNTLSVGTLRGTKYTIADCSCPKGKYLKKRKRLQKFGM